MRLGPKAVPEFAAADVQGTQRRHRSRAVFHPAHARAFQAFANDLAARLRGTAANVPTVLPVSGVSGAMAVVLEVTDQLAQLLMNLCRCAWRQLERMQVREQGFASLLIENALGLLLPLRAGLEVAGMPYPGEMAQVFGGMI